jgi:8-oxo-dGTP pyrophosphatase MutT (NUDIX family)
METIKTQKSERKIEYQNKYFHVFSQEVNFGTFSKKYYVTEFGTKACLMILDGDSILLTRQYRFIVDRPVWEIPGGKAEEGEDAAESAVRECEEETGIRGLDVKPLINYLQGLDCSTANVRLFYATEFETVKKFEPDPKEVDMIRWVPFAECMQMVASGEIVDHASIVAFLYYQHLKNTGHGI